MFKGSFVALVTPFTPDGRIAEREFQSMVEWHVASGTHGVVPVGTTGETCTLSIEEHCRVIDLCVEAAAGRMKVIAGAGSNATDTAITLASYAKQKKADAILTVTPYYNKPSQDGLYFHYKAIADSVDIPIILYNVPSRCGVDLSVDTVARLADIPNVAGIKEASPDLARPLCMRERIERSDFCYLSGEDTTVAAYLAQGGDGCISVTANVAPKACADMHNAWQARDMDTFNTLRDYLAPLHRVLFIESNPVPVKFALSRFGKCEDSVRLPLVKASYGCRTAVEDVLAKMNLLTADGHEQKRA